MAGSYRVHPYLQDWLVEGLNTPPRPVLFIAALTCVTHNMDNELSPQFWVRSRQLLENVTQLETAPFHSLWQSTDCEEIVLSAANNIAGLHRQWDQHGKARQMYMRALTGRVKALGPDHPSTLDTVYNLGALYHDQGKLNEAEHMYIRARIRREKVLNSHHASTLDTIHNLSVLCRDSAVNQWPIQHRIHLYYCVLLFFGEHTLCTLQVGGQLGLCTVRLTVSTVFRLFDHFSNNPNPRYIRCNKAAWTECGQEYSQVTVSVRSDYMKIFQRI